MSNDETMTKSENRNTSADESFWYNDAESVVREELAKPRVYDLEERTARFGAATSVSANYVEADDAVSKKEFLKNIGTCRKEAREAKHFLRMIVRAVPELKPQARTLWLEAKELNLIFSKIWRSK